MNGLNPKPIPKLTATLTRLSLITAPPIVTRTARDHWAEYADAPAALDGDAIVHEDPNPTNFVIDGDRAWMVDFGWAIRGPAWMTSANLIISLMEDGWEPADADSALKAVPAWASALRADVDEYASATLREWDRVMERGPLHEMWQHRAAVAPWCCSARCGDQGGHPLTRIPSPGSRRPWNASNRTTQQTPRVTGKQPDYRRPAILRNHTRQPSRYTLRSMFARRKINCQARGKPGRQNNARGGQIVRPARHNLSNCNEKG